ncbi:hypothetical protein [Solidesulfovibrio sp.]
MALKFSTGLRNALLDAGSFQDVLANGVMYLYSGAQPTDPDAAATGSLLLKITVASGAFSHGTTTNGLNFGAAVAGVLPKSTSEIWSGVCVAAGTIGWFRFCANAADSEPTDADTVRKSFDGSIASSGAQLLMSSVTVAIGDTRTIDSFTVTLPAGS